MAQPPLTLTATRYIKTVESVSTRPIKVEAVDSNGKRVKCYLKRDTGYHPHFREALCSHIARRCGIPVPIWYAVLVPEGLEIPDQPDLASFKPGQRVFGTLAMDDHGYQPVDATDCAPGMPRDEEYAIYLLDALVQNKDRTTASPNLLIHPHRGFMAIDHEFTLGARSTTRELEDALELEYHQQLARAHVLTDRLRYRPSPCWTSAQVAYLQIAHEELMAFISGLPPEWLPSVGEQETLVSKLNCFRRGMTHFAELLKTATFSPKCP